MAWRGAEPAWQVGGRPSATRPMAERADDADGLQRELDIIKYHVLISEEIMASSYSIGKHFEELIDGLVESGRYATASEVMREGLRLVEEREERRKTKLDALRAEIQKGFDSGPAEDSIRAICSSASKQQGRKRLPRASMANRFDKTTTSRAGCRHRSGAFIADDNVRAADSADRSHRQRSSTC